MTFFSPRFVFGDVYSRPKKTIIRPRIYFCRSFLAFARLSLLRYTYAHRRRRRNGRPCTVNGTGRIKYSIKCVYFIILRDQPIKYRASDWMRRRDGISKNKKLECLRATRYRYSISLSLSLCSVFTPHRLVRATATAFTDILLY